MKVQHGKDLANHSGPESCGDAREGVPEALTGETGGSAIEPRNPNSGTPPQLSDAEGNMDQAIKASPGAVPRGRRPCTRREVSCTEAGRSPPRPAGRRRAVPGRPRAARLDNQRWRSRMCSYYRGSRRTKAMCLRRWWREGAQPRGTLNRTPHPGHRAGPVVRRRAWKAYVRQRAGIGGCSSRRSCITSRRSC